MTSPHRKVYEKSISNWPEEDRPREKLLKQGADSLSNAELLAILLRVGVPGMSAVDLGRQILQETGGLRALANWAPEELYRIHGLSVAKVAQLKAAVALGERVMSEKKRDLGKIYSPQQVYEFILPQLRDLKKEVFKVLFLNARNQILEMHTVSQGTLTESLVPFREIFALANRYGATNIVCAHNHPSGSPDPSTDDIKTTRALVIAGEALQIPLLDHIIVGENRYYSFSESGEIENFRQQIRGLIRKGV
ncbi:MAG: JAB domain-containing protein [Calditrichaeota bacterium]|nr:JAB domain-containing protein [Calditrichota bacterium]